jgi:hypothetical protein
MKKIYLVLPIIMLFASGCNSGNQVTNAQNSALSSQIAQQTQSASATDQRQCASDGKAFADQWIKENVPTYSAYSTTVYISGAPEYHFNTKLNTCLVYLYYQYNSTTDLTTTSFINEIYNVYSNTPILESNETEVCNNFVCSNKDLNGFYGGSTPLSKTDFLNQKAILFSQ